MRGSEFYGIQHVLYRHAGLLDLGVFPYSVQHGWQNVPTRFEADDDPVELWAWSERIADAMRGLVEPSRVRVVGSPYLYLPPSAGPAHRKGAVYILPHSSHFARIGFSYEHLMDLLADIRARAGGCDVLVYYLDVNPELCALFRSAGARILVNGGLWSSRFLHHFRDNIRRYRSLYYSSFGSGVLFARHEGLETVHVALESRLQDSSNPHLNAISTVPYDPVGACWDTDLELGAAHVLAPQALRELILRGIREPVVLRRGPRRWVGNLRSGVRDHWNHVRPVERMVRYYNLST
ncbi:MAG: hypothetical protein J0H69_17755 [Burkholderiales bacterium]|nr:hypothetical protein [Burkholderiales bacterium]